MGAQAEGEKVGDSVRSFAVDSRLVMETAKCNSHGSLKSRTSSLQPANPKQRNRMVSKLRLLR